MGLITAFSSRKRKEEDPLYIGSVTVANETIMKISILVQIVERD